MSDTKIKFPIKGTFSGKKVTRYNKNKRRNYCMYTLKKNKSNKKNVKKAYSHQILYFILCLCLYNRKTDKNFVLFSYCYSYIFVPKEILLVSKPINIVSFYMERHLFLSVVTYTPTNPFILKVKTLSGPRCRTD